MSQTSDVLHARFSEQIFTYTDMGLILLDRNAYIEKLTKAAADILGGKQELFIQKNLFELYKSSPRARRLIPKNAFEGQTVRNRAITWHNGERQFELLIDTYPIFDDDHHLLGVSVFMKDVTNVRSLENQIRRNERLAMIGQMSAGTAHEIRNPLTSIKGFLQIIKQSLNAKGMKKEVNYTQIMLEEIERINHLVGEFLVLGRSQDSKYEKIDLSELMDQLLPMIQSEALLQGIEVKAQDFASLPPVMGEKDLVKQVILNLSKNAIEAMGGQGTLTIDYDILKEEKMISLNFHDTGPGIPDDVLDKIYEPFFTTKENGTGLGLSVCHRIIHDMSGKITVSSKKGGTTFHIQIPYPSTP